LVLLLSERQIFLSLLIYSTMRDTRHDSAMHRHR